MGVEGESEENLRRFEREREEGYVDGEPKGMNPRVLEEFSAELKIMRAQLPPAPAEYIGTFTSNRLLIYGTRIYAPRRSVPYHILTQLQPCLKSQDLPSPPPSEL